MLEAGFFGWVTDRQLFFWGQGVDVMIGLHPAGSLLATTSKIITVVKGDTELPLNETLELLEGFGFGLLMIEIHKCVS